MRTKSTDVKHNYKLIIIYPSSVPGGIFTPLTQFLHAILGLCRCYDSLWLLALKNGQVQVQDAVKNALLFQESGFSVFWGVENIHQKFNEKY